MADFPVKREFCRSRGGEFVCATVEIRQVTPGGRDHLTRPADERLVLSITGTAGYVVTRAQAKKEAKESNVAYFEDLDTNGIANYNSQWGTNFRSPRAMAQYVLDTDGEFAGLDVHRETDKHVWITHSAGQIREEIAEWFPEIEWLLPYHLNDMKRGPNGEDDRWYYEPLPARVVEWVLRGELIGPRDTL